MEHKSCNSGSDKISELPKRVIHQILCGLPIKDAFRTSILSSKWRCIWKTIPDLVFDDEVATTLYKVVDIVDHILRLRCAPIRKFKMVHQSRAEIYVSDIDRFIIRLSETPLEEFILELLLGETYAPSYTLPSCIFGFENLIHLRLCHCELKLPTTFKGFNALKTLYLSNCYLREKEFETLIAKCSLLERLTYLRFYCYDHLNIEAPNLQVLNVEGYFYGICLINTFKLTSVDIFLNRKVCRITMGLENYGDLQKFHDNLPQLHRLAIGGYFLNYLAVLQVASNLSTPCKNMTYLLICIDFSDSEDISAALHLLKSCPKLVELEIIHEHGKNKVGRWGHVRKGYDCANYEYSKMSLGKLRLVKIMEISGGSREVEFINFMLSNSPVLEGMTVQPHSDCSEEQLIDLLKVLLRSQRLSEAKVVYLDPI